jgi:LPS sulfotransferase NodH
MADKTIKKVLIFACPRTGSTIIQQIIAFDLFRIPNLIEPFNNPKLGFVPSKKKTPNVKPANLYRWAREQTEGVMKLLAINLDYVDANLLLTTGNFDRVVIIERRNLVDCCVSLYLAEQTAKYHYYQGDSHELTPFKCDTGFVDQWVKMYLQYSTALKQVKNSGVPYDIICYEDFMNNQIQYVADVPLQNSNSFKNTISLELPYQDLCLNYLKVKKRIEKALHTPKRSNKLKTERRKKKLVKKINTLSEK